MRLLHLTALLAAVAPALAWAQGAEPAGPPPARQISVSNDTGQTVLQLFVAPVGAPEGEDRLGSGTLPPRASLRVPLGRTRACQFALRAVLDDGGEERRRVDVCRATRVSLAESGPRREVTVINATDFTMRELYLTPGGQAQGASPGPDRLGADTVASGASKTLRVRGLPACVVNLRAVFEDDSIETRDAVDVCRQPRLVFGDPNAPVREITLVNRSRGVLRELYARPSGQVPWGPDRLGAGVLGARENTRLRLRGGCLYDLRAVREDGTAEVKRAVDVCNATEVAVGVGGGETRRVTLANGYGRTVRQVFLTPAEADEWGEDLLGDNVLLPGTREEFPLEGGCLADLRIVFDNEAAEERRDLDICAATTVRLRPGWTVEERRPSATDPVPAGSSRLRNAGPLPLVELYADPPGSARGPDRLGATVLGVGESIVFAPPAGCVADLVAVSRDGRETSRAGIDLCAGAEVVLP